MKAEDQRARVVLDRIGPDDPRYATLVGRGFNQRFAGKPDYVRLVHSTAEVIDAVQDAVREGRRVVARGGGHCLEGFVDDPDVRVIIDTSLMTGVRHDADMRAFVIDAGTTLGEAYRRLFLDWGVTLPAGESPYLGLGAHVSGGAFGFLCRQHGLAADHLYGLEVVVVDAEGTARSVVATCEPSDPNRDLWWAHTGAGGGNFGIVTRCWFRSPGATGNDPASLLPKAPESILLFRLGWSWDDMDATSFARLATNFGNWCGSHSDASSPFARLFSTLFLWRRQLGKLELKGLSTAGADADRLAGDHIAAITRGISAPCTRSLERTSWLNFALNPFPELFAAVANGALFKGKDAFLRRRFTDRQIDTAHRHLTRSDVDVAGGMLGLASYGGHVNTVAPDATASAQRDSIMTTSCSAGWGNPNDESSTIAWVRELYRDLFADTGGVPAPGDICDGAMINHPDVDLADPEWNRSGVPWHTLYFKSNYPALQRVKRRWDPQNVFHHALSIRP
jgi:hypothetical protein